MAKKSFQKLAISTKNISTAVKQGCQILLGAMYQNG
jgi:hypothetical protein